MGVNIVAQEEASPACHWNLLPGKNNITFLLFDLQTDRTGRDCRSQKGELNETGCFMKWQ